MSREWKPGDVATIGTRPLLHLGDNRWADSFGYQLPLSAEEPRPLVVIDPEDREAVERLGALMRASGCRWSTDVQTALREFANPTPPRIDEPGTWGVVEASCVHSDQRREWVKFPSGNWHSVRSLPHEHWDIENPDDWDSLIEPALVREGVQP